MSDREPFIGDYFRLQLPPELWGLVMDYLPRADQRSCLSVSAAFHDLACPLVFSRIVIHYGLCSAQGPEPPGPCLAKSDLRLLEWRIITAKEILQRIARDVQFARSVKAITVLAYQMGSNAGESDSDFETHMVIALESLPRLRVFQWYGFRPPLSTSVLGALARAAGSRLIKLDICGVLGINQDASPYVAQFKALRTLSLTGDVIHFPISRGSKEDFRIMFARCAQHVPSTLLHLSIWREGIWAIPLPVLSGLQELSMLDPTNLDRLGDIFGHCAQLRSLAIACIGADCGLEVLAALQAAPNALPYLTSFKLVLSREAYIPDAGPFIEFFKNKEGMRRLDLQFNRLYPFGDVDEYSRFLDIFAQLPQLQVVGLDLTGPALRLEHLELLDERLPLGLSALLLKWSTYTSIASGIDTQDWIDMLKRRPSLGYLHTLYTENDISLGTVLDLGEPLLMDRPPALRLFGYGAQICSIECDPATGESMYGPPWSDAAVSVGAVEDFGCEDWAWLIRYHTLFVRPG
ncbi:uncharacterized protein TRAVEDRAFT_73320 [Trametes versicolor FP-101664 SS1]|uniref:uncharacterized protein n=1 Tax=Trametes versicolor (strain FP-101664) TaxID=717944 RepID=UPI0004623476|nr:uncharacterized protein TRAVEDRAFT_73320 [Trametes versicolor FP-101664 SS1]EIW57068.1 hypothetical protein TRAVEDRAFT_73320 [Trametes versicolor FP-101664 SS1]